MPTPAPSNPNLTPAAAGDPVAAPNFEARLHTFWEKYANAVYMLCAIVLIAIIGKGGYESYVAHHENEIGADYAAASSNEKLKAFATGHPGHQLAGVARLRLGDDAYTNGDFTQASLDYQAAVEVLKAGPFAGRARLGLAMAKLLGGQTADGENQLKQLANDVGQMKTVRAEATYQLAAQANAAGHTDEALKYLDQIMTIEPSGVWAQRAMMLRSTLSASTAAVGLPSGGSPSASKVPAKP